MANIHCPYCDRDFEIPELKEEEMTHRSDCAVHNEPAYPKGYCDCGADIISEARDWLQCLIKDYLSDQKDRHFTGDEEFVEKLTEDILVLKGHHFCLKIVGQ